mgnify:CR=1 FL=1
MAARAMIIFEGLAQETLQLVMILILLAFLATNMFPPASRASTSLQIGDSATAKRVDPATIDRNACGKRITDRGSQEQER